MGRGCMLKKQVQGTKSEKECGLFFKELQVVYHSLKVEDERRKGRQKIWEIDRVKPIEGSHGAMQCGLYTTGNKDLKHGSDVRNGEKRQTQEVSILGTSKGWGLIQCLTWEREER